ncbi:MAG: hypothetical protein D3916_10245 [Candidatus Electrothrix sp. MAN1_4]|nr:hypothetical protein [Candidatus Electrothrix sp. MAN1_4]
MYFLESFLEQNYNTIWRIASKIFLERIQENHRKKKEILCASENTASLKASGAYFHRFFLE